MMMTGSNDAASPSLSTRERDRRYALVRERLGERGVDCAIVARTNLCYLSNGLPGERFGLFPTHELPLMVAMHDRNLVDLPPGAFHELQDWVEDIRPGNDGSSLVARVAELGIGGGTIGLTDSKLGYGGLSHGIVAALESAYPSATFVDVSDIFADVRACKSDEELAMIAEANRVLDAGIDAVCRLARPGMSGAQVVHTAIMAMWEAGGDTDSTMPLSCWSVPTRNHVLQQLTMRRIIAPGDVGILTGFVHYGHYMGHGDQQICFGPPKTLHEEMFEAVRFVHDAILQEIKPGATQRQLEGAYQRACAETGFRTSTQCQIHQYGLDGVEFPGPGFAVSGSGRDFVLRPGMVYSIAPALTASDSEDTVIGGTTIVVATDGWRAVGSPRMELRSVASG